MKAISKRNRIIIKGLIFPAIEKTQTIKAEAIIINNINVTRFLLIAWYWFIDAILNNVFYFNKLNIKFYLFFNNQKPIKAVVISKKNIIK